MSEKRANGDGLDCLVGRTVRLKGRKCTAKIERILRDIEGGVRLDREIDGFCSWNIEDLDVLVANVEGDSLSPQEETDGQ